MTRSLTVVFPWISTGPMWASFPGSAMNVTVAVLPSGPSSSETSTFAYG